MNEINNIFSNLGFPVAMVAVLLYFLYAKVWIRIETTLDRVTKTNEELSQSNRILTNNMNEKLSELASKLNIVDEIKDDVEDIKNKMNK